MNYFDRLRQFRKAAWGLMQELGPALLAIRDKEHQGGIDGMGNYCERLKIAPKFPVEHLTDFEIQAHEWEITRTDREAVFRALGCDDKDLALMDEIEAKRLATVPKERLKLT